MVTNRTFDKLNRVLTETYPPTTDDDVAYTYDKGDFGIGRLTSFTDHSGSTVFTYNARGDILTDKRTIDDKTYTVSYAYDLADHVSSITYPDGRTVGYTRDAFGRISAVALRDKPIVSDVAYERFGPVSGMTFGNGISAAFTYDLDYRLTGIEAKPVQNLAMAYDGVNDITSIMDLSACKENCDKISPHDWNSEDNKDRNNSQSFTYDADYRLLTADGLYGAETFTYDADGNRLNEETTAADHKTRTRTLRVFWHVKSARRHRRRVPPRLHLHGKRRPRDRDRRQRQNLHLRRPQPQQRPLHAGRSRRRRRNLRLQRAWRARQQGR